MIITLFGGGDSAKEKYSIGEDLAYDLGKKIALNGHILRTGGNAGVVEAAAKGCFEAGGKVIGIVLDNPSFLELGSESPYFSKVIKMKEYKDRIKELLKSDRIIVLPGRLGTMEELFTAWTESVIKDLEPVIVLGQKNKELLDFLFSKNFVQKKYSSYVNYTNNINDIEFLK